MRPVLSATVGNLRRTANGPPEALQYFYGLSISRTVVALDFSACKITVFPWR
jgi:hypothetical protein